MNEDPACTMQLCHLHTIRGAHAACLRVGLITTLYHTASAVACLYSNTTCTFIVLVQGAFGFGYLTTTSVLQPIPMSHAAPLLPALHALHTSARRTLLLSSSCADRIVAELLGTVPNSERAA